MSRTKGDGGKDGKLGGIETKRKYGNEGEMRHGENRTKRKKHGKGMGKKEAEKQE